MSDKSPVTNYLSRLQTGFTIREYPVTGLVPGQGAIIAPFDANRILIAVYSTSITTNTIGFKLPSGEFFPWFPEQGQYVFLANLQQHYQIPTYEWSLTNYSGIGSFVAYGIIKT